ncbi:FimV/HubP family polar landmark protein [Bordetella bronchialis]|uniref:FimV/HubP family polar landmark protein n=1 Tax=Bordetella bronchialis TaxID=463025 RepID=UPI003D058DAD
MHVSSQSSSTPFPSAVLPARHATSAQSVRQEAQADTASAAARRSSAPLHIVAAADDTVFGIAQRHRDAIDAGICQIAAALWRHNPHAFQQNDMNRLKAGVRIELPAAETIRAIPAQEAARLCAAHIDPDAQKRHGTVGVTVRASYEDQRTLRQGERELVYFRDTLGAIAQRFHVPGATLHQKLVAMATANPDAFRNGNMNALRTGVLLRMPTDAQVLAMDAESAKAEVGRQWREYQGYTRPAMKC